MECTEGTEDTGNTHRGDTESAELHGKTSDPPDRSVEAGLGFGRPWKVT
jgi:hypothetical protein